MVRSSAAIALVLSLLVPGSARSAEAPEDARPQKNSFAVRPKFGANFLLKGKLGDRYDELIQGELGLKGTLGHFGLEFGVGGMRGEASESSPFGKEEYTLRMASIKLTGTYEFNPFAGLKGHGDEGNLYLGGGMGFYPMTEEGEVKLADPEDPGRLNLGETDGFGFGVHVVVGGEYYFVEHFSLFAEVQYSYVDFDREGTSNANLFGFTALGGVAFKF